MQIVEFCHIKDKFGPNSLNFGPTKYLKMNYLILKNHD